MIKIFFCFFSCNTADLGSDSFILLDLLAALDDDDPGDEGENGNQHENVRHQGIQTWIVGLPLLQDQLGGDQGKDYPVQAGQEVILPQGRDQGPPIRLSLIHI